MIRFALLAALLLPQDPANEAVTLSRELRKGFDASADTEVRLRLGEVVRRMSDRASLSLCGDHEDPDQLVLRLYDVHNITAKVKDFHSADFWRWFRPEEGTTFTLEEPREWFLGDELLVDLIKELTGGERWQGDAAIDRAPNGSFVVNAPPALHRRVARVVQNLQKESLESVRISVALFASPRPLSLGAAPDGSISEEAWEKLCRQTDEGGTVKRLGSIETVAHHDQTVASFSGVRRPVAMVTGENGPISSTVPDGLALEAAAIPSGERFSLRLRLAYTKVQAIEEIPTPKGTLRLPRLAEAAYSDLRTIPAGRHVVLGTLGPIAGDSELPPHVTVVARVSWVRP